MAFTKPTGDQITFRSATTGRHTLDSYLEACERGEFSLPALMDNLFTEEGGLNPATLRFRVSDEDPDAPVFQARFGMFEDPDEGWFDTNQNFFNQRGLFARNTEYQRLDMVRDVDAVYVCTEAHLSTTVFDPTKFVLFFDGAAVLSEIQSFKTTSEPRIDLLEESVLLGINVL